MIAYSPTPGSSFGSVEQAIRECEGLLLLLKDPATTAKVFAAIPGAIRGACELEAQPAVNVAVSAETGHLRIVAEEGAVQPGALEALEND
jgi:hypothetical protein